MFPKSGYALEEGAGHGIWFANTLMTVKAGGEAFPLARLRVRRDDVLGGEERVQLQYPRRGFARLLFELELRIGGRQHGPHATARSGFRPRCRSRSSTASLGRPAR